jgi:hypothetical protein
VLGTIVTTGNVNDSHLLQPLVERIMEKVKKPLAVAGDAYICCHEHKKN